METASAEVGVCGPPFWKANPVLWFYHIAAEFNTAGISLDEIKYCYVVQALNGTVLTEVSDLVSSLVWFVIHRNPSDTSDSREGSSTFFPQP